MHSLPTGPLRRRGDSPAFRFLWPLALQRAPWKSPGAGGEAPCGICCCHTVHTRPCGRHRSGPGGGLAARGDSRAEGCDPQHAQRLGRGWAGSLGPASLKLRNTGLRHGQKWSCSWRRAALLIEFWPPPPERYAVGGGEPAGCRPAGSKTIWPAATFSIQRHGPGADPPSAEEFQGAIPSGVAAGRSSGWPVLVRSIPMRAGRPGPPAAALSCIARQRAATTRPPESGGPAMRRVSLGFRSRRRAGARRKSPWWALATGRGARARTRPWQGALGTPPCARELEFAAGAGAVAGRPGGVAGLGRPGLLDGGAPGDRHWRRRLPLGQLAFASRLVALVWPGQRSAGVGRSGCSFPSANSTAGPVVVCWWSAGAGQLAGSHRPALSAISAGRRCSRVGGHPSGGGPRLALAPQAAPADPCLRWWLRWRHLRGT